MVIGTILALGLLGPGRIVDVERHESFAGKLGHRVEYRLTIERYGKRYQVSAGRHHTNLAGKKPEFQVGDTFDPRRF